MTGSERHQVHLSSQPRWSALGQAALATARALLAAPMARGEAPVPGQRQAGGDSVLWVRVDLPALPADRVWHLRLPELRFDRVTLYRYGADGHLIVEQAGEAVPASQWTERTRMPRFRLGVPQAAPAVLVLRVENRSPYWLDLAAVDGARLLDDEQAAILMLAAYFGVMGFAVLYTACCASSSRATACTGCTHPIWR